MLGVRACGDLLLAFEIGDGDDLGIRTGVDIWNAGRGKEGGTKISGEESGETNKV